MRLRAFLAVVITAVSLIGLGVPASAAAGTEVGAGMYPRVVRLQHSGTANGTYLASSVAFPSNRPQGVAKIYSSSDGRAYTNIATIDDATASRGICCGTLYELPAAVGGLPAGTLLWAASFGGGSHSASQPMVIRAWRSTDHGRTWQFLATVATARNAGGIWEPEFAIASDGRLVCYYSDETDANHSQKLVETTSSNGVNWAAPNDIVAVPNRDDRPGMPGVRRLPNGTFVMAYEICGPTYGCAAMLRTSADGVGWGAVTAAGSRPATSDGTHFAHTPTIALTGSTVVLIGQVLLTANGAAKAGNGGAMLVGTVGGAWTQRTAPVTVAGPSVGSPGPVQNYSPSLVFSADGKSLAEVTTADKAGVSTVYAGVAAF
ncbi:sialidase family protein [Amycolatopsis sp. NPDC098790]|uniref:sialidase family protein n=1 Tax=Amycolatopsis sp. NPDC098790 TaxID=3363939 RepID=UPI0037FE732D